jgi:tetratricopeptide (TPR) repeat protein
MKPGLHFWVFMVSIWLPLMLVCSGAQMDSTELLKKADEQFGRSEFSQALPLYEKAADNAEKERDSSNLVEAYSQVARCYIKQDSLEIAREWLSRAEVYASENEPLGWSRYLGVRGRVEWKEKVKETGELAPEASVAASTFRDMYDYCIENGLYERAIDAANMMTIIGDKRQRISWGLKGIEAAERGGYDNWLALLWNNLGWNYDEAEQPDKALEALKSAREYHYKSDKQMPKLIADWSVGYAFRKAGDIDSASSWISNVWQRADSLYKIEPSTEHAEWLGFACREMGEISLAEGLNNEALGHFHEAESRLTEAGMADWDQEGLEELKRKIEELESDR